MKMFTLKICLIVLIDTSIFFQTLDAQVSLPILPFSKQYELNSEIPILELPHFNNDSLDFLFNNPTKSTYTKNTVGLVTPLDIDMLRLGRWDSIESEKIVWRLRLISPGSKGLRISCDQFLLPKGASLFFYDSTGSRCYGAFTELNNQPHGRFSTGILPMEDVTIEYNHHSNNQEIIAPFHINKISYIFRVQDIGEADQQCDIDANCPNWANEWCNEIRSVVKILFRSRIGIVETDNIGSGVLINPSC
ncbi:MAG: hypothetical protein R3C61_23365 [Bacteroidia bacterium]